VKSLKNFLKIKLVIIATAVFGGNELEVNNIKFPRWAHGIGIAISALPIAIIILCALYQIYNHKDNWVILSNSIASIFYTI
jgi:hypothetical protein